MEDVPILVDCSESHFFLTDLEVQEVIGNFSKRNLGVILLDTCSYLAGTTGHEVMNSTLLFPYLLIEVVMPRKNDVYASIYECLLPAFPQLFV